MGLFNVHCSDSFLALGLYRVVQTVCIYWLTNSTGYLTVICMGFNTYQIWWLVITRQQ